MLLHGDDFATVGTREEVKWFKAALENMFKINTQCMGPGAVASGWKSVAGPPQALLRRPPMANPFKKLRRVVSKCELVKAFV